jgi:NAD(P)-dependent dehydrogenase (short-subunit alcohol dehydrogenase family)
MINSLQPSARDSVFRLGGRHALVTGGVSGIGETTVKELARAGRLRDFTARHSALLQACLLSGHA